MFGRRIHLCWAGAAIAGLLTGCRAQVELATLPEDSPSRRAASSFLHCVESTTSHCVSAGQTTTAWDAVALLAWLAYGSPSAIATLLPQQVQVHQDPRLLERRFVDEIERYAVALRGAGCEAEDEQSLAPIIERAGAQAVTRSAALSLWPREVPPVVDQLREEAQLELSAGVLVTLRCRFEPFVVYAATHVADGQYTVVGMSTFWPEELGGVRLTSEQVEARLRGRSLGLYGASVAAMEDTINPWLAFPVEEL